MGTSTADADFTNVNNWRGVDATPTAGSQNLVTSGGALEGIRSSRKNTIDLINNGVTNPFAVNSSERKLGSYTNKQQASGVGEYTYNETNGYYIIPVSDFCGYKVSADHATQYGLVSSYVEGEYIKYCDGCDRVTGVPTELTIPYDCNYLYLYVATNTSSVSVEIDGLPETGLEELKEAVAPISGMDARLESVETDLADLDEELFGSQVISSIDVSSTGTITFNPITLSQNGDELEIDVEPDSSITGVTLGGYPFTFGDTETAIRFAVSTIRAALRADDSTWLIPTTTDISTGKLKIKYTGGNIEFYDNGTLIYTYTGQKTVTIYGMGSQDMTGYGKWFGRINSFKYTHNGVTTDLWNLSWFIYNSGVTINRVTTSGAISEIEEQISEIKEVPNVVVSATSDAVTVHFRLNSKYYGVLPINHMVNHSDAVFQDLWGISGTDVNIGNIATYSNGQFTNINKCLLEGAENEFAIQFYSDDFTGGVHGDERIDVENDCYVVFIVDGKEYTISELIALGTIQCDTFAYRQKSALYTLYSVTSSHDVLAYHVKRTEFKDGGYVTRNYIEMVQGITAMNTYSGLICANKDIADYCINNAGTIFAATHPATAAKITDFVNNTSFEAKIYKGNTSCICNSRVIGGNVSSFNSAPVKVNMFDRQYDIKYYAVMPQNVELTSSSVFEFECSVKFDYREDS